MSPKPKQHYTFELECIFRDGHRRRMPMGPCDPSTSVAIAWGKHGATPWTGTRKRFPTRKDRPMLVRVFRGDELWREFDDDAGRHTFDADPPPRPKARRKT